MKRLLIIFFTFFTIDSIAQQTIKGRVVSSDENTPIPGCSVFISNTTIGVASDKEGRFEITNIPEGRHELVVSSVGYETIVFSFTTSQLPLRLKFELNIKPKELANVNVEPSVEEGWDKWGKLFFSSFIGTDKNAEHCKIRNTDKIKFRYYKKSGRIIAYADEPIVIENKALGYLIKYQLEAFEQNNIQKSLYFLGYPLFEDFSAGEKEIKPKWEKRRLEAYSGSVVHFMSSLYSNTITEEGFELRRMIRSRNLEKDRVRKIIQAAINLAKDSSGKTVPVNPHQLPGLPPDSNKYYNRIMHQNDFIDKYDTVLLTADSIVSRCDSGYKCLSFENYLSVTFKNEKEEPKYLLSIMQNRPPAFQRSLATLINTTFIFINRTGSYYMPQDFFIEGYWGWSEKISTLLPVDYMPPAAKNR